MAHENPLWGAPRIHGEILKLGLDVAQATVSSYMPRTRKPPSESWRTFLKNHVTEMASIDFFTVPVATFRVLYGCLTLSHERRRVIHFNVTASPTVQWTGRQLVQAFPWDTAPKPLLRDRDAIYGPEFLRSISNLAIVDVRTSPQSPWQNPYVERLIGSIRRECLDHVVILNEKHLRRVLRATRNASGLEPGGRRFMPGLCSDAARSSQFVYATPHPENSPPRGVLTRHR